MTSGSSCRSVNASLPTKASVLNLGEDTRVQQAGGPYTYRWFQNLSQELWASV